MKYIFKRIILVFFTMFLILSLTYILMKNIPRYPPLDPNLDPEVYELYEAKYGYNQPIFTQYVKWLQNIVTDWDWGVSTEVQPNVPSFQVLSSKLPVTLKLNFYSLFVFVPLGFLFGIIAALRKNKPIDHIISLLVIVFISVPSFVIITVLMISAKNFNLPPQWGSADELNWTHYVIPILALSLGSIAGLTRYTRAELSEVLTSDFILLARTKGLNKSQTVLRHALRNSMVPLMPMIIGSFVSILSGSLILENIYGIPGVGGIFKESLDKQDYNLTMTVLAFYTVIGLFATLVVDLSYGIVDPRIRMGAR